MNPHISACDDYLNARTGKYEWRRIRYRAALEAMERHGLNHTSTIMDIGAGWTELDYCIRTEGGYRCRYLPIDGCIDGVDLEAWTPPREAEFFVALELIEHLEQPWRLVEEMQKRTTRALVISTPNPETTDVLGMDATHKTPIWPSDLIAHGFKVEEREFYGQQADSLFGIWTP